jgi:hypothetical protein
MLIRVTGLDYVAGIVIDDDKVVRTAPKLKWAKGLTTDQLRVELSQRSLRATVVRTLPLKEMQTRDAEDADDDGNQD